MDAEIQSISNILKHDANFKSEFEILKRVKHHHIVELVGSYTDRRYLGLIMSPVAGCNLAEFLAMDSSKSVHKSTIQSVFRVSCYCAGIFT